MILGTLATSAADYVNSSFSVVTSDILRDQDIPMICRTIQIHSDDVVERTEYFTVSLRRLGGFVYDSCEVAIFDGNGGKQLEYVPSSVVASFYNVV